MTTVLDRIFLGGLILLILATPFMIGSAPPRAYSAMEAAIFVLVIVWMIKLLSVRGEASEVRGDHRLPPNPSRLTSSVSRLPSSSVLPLVLFAGLIFFQLMPLPPSLIRLISPGTYEFYSQIFFGWPEQAPYGDLGVGAGSTEQGAGGQAQNAESMEQGARGREPDAKSSGSGSQQSDSGSLLQAPSSKLSSPPSGSLLPASSSLLPATWLPLTVAPYLTRIDLLKLLAYGALFFLVLCYPYGESWERESNESSPLGKRPPDERLLRRLVWAVLTSGFLVAFVGFLQRFTWNGKILWFYEPYATKPPAAGAITRASGPFVNPDHFANYLALVLPLTLACVIFRTALADRERQPMLRIFGGCAAFLMFTGVLLSLSRGALAAVCMSIAVLLALLPWGEAKKKGAKNFMFRGVAIGRLSAIVFCALLIVGLYFAGPSGRDQVDARLAGGLVDEISLGGRSQIWRDSPKLIADYPLFGVGLGAWPEVFMRYRSDPFGLNFFREAHNDYIQLMSEAGIIGFALVVWFVFMHGRRLLQGLSQVTSRYRPLIAAMVAGFAGMALHEWFDFNLRIPANAFLFVVLAALALRAVSSEALRARGREQGAGGSEPGAGSREQGASRAAGEPQPEFVAATPFGLSRSVSEFFSMSAAMHFALSSLHPRSLLAVLSSWFQISGSLLRAPCSLLPAPCFAVGSDSGSVLHAPSAASSGSGSMLHTRSFRLAAPSTLLPAIVASRFTPYGVIVLCLFLAVQSLNQNPIPYPFNLGEAESLAEAKENVLIFPTNALYHDTILNFLGDPPPLVWQLRQLSAALWLEPANPYFRDRYAAALVRAGRPDEALREITVSVYNAPDFNVHAYLEKDALAKLPPEQQRAIEAGFHRAMARHSPSAVAGLGEFYAGVGRFAEQAALYEQAALAEKDPGRKVDLALRAGAAYAKAQNFAKAERLMSEAIVSNRADPRPYEYLIREIYGARKDLLGAKQILSEGLRNGAPALALNLALAEAAHKAENADELDNALAAAKSVVTEAAKELYPFEMYLQLADGAGRVGARDQELAAMLAALELQPTDSEVLSRIANVYSSQKNYDRAVMYLEKLAQVEYNSGYVFFRLAAAEEARYRYAAAGRAYIRAVELDPDNKDYKTAYAKFKQQVSENAAANKSREQGAGSKEPQSKAGSAEQGAKSQNRARSAKPR